MDDRRLNPSEPDRPADTAVVQLRDKRRRFQELLSTQRDQLSALETALEQQFERLRLATAEQARDSAPMVDLVAFENQRTALASEAESLAQLSEELDDRQHELVEFETRLKEQEQTVVEQLRQQQTELDERAADLDAAGTQLRQAQRALAASEEELVADRERAAQLRERLQEQLHSAEHEREATSTRRSETNNQRRRIARELQHQRQAQKAELAKEREALRAERETLRTERELLRQEHAQQLAEVSRRRDEARQLAIANDEHLHGKLEAAVSEATDLRRQLAEQKRADQARVEELDSLRDEHALALEEISVLRMENDRQISELSAQQQSEEHTDVEIERLRADVETLRGKLADAESRAASAPTDKDGRKRDDLKRRFELAMEDLRELKRRNAELEEQLATGKSAATRQAGSDKLDWEAQKRRLLAELEADGDEDEEQQEQRLSIEGTIRITDEIVARKDQEIAELKRVLEEQSSNLGTVAIGASAIAEALDQDELIRQERENLAAVQQEWRDKLKQAEIDISLERARVARERLELDEKLQWLEAEKQKLPLIDGKGGKGDPGSAAQRRWWARLGLKETDEK